MPPTTDVEAIKYFQNKIPVSAEEFYAMSDRLRHYAFTVSRVSSLDTLYRIHNSLGTILARGGTLDDFKKDLDNMFSKAGVNPLQPWHIETIFRTNSMSAYSAGKRLQQSMADRNLFPMLRRISAGDSRVRPSHRRWHGFTAPIDDPIWNTIYPPDDYNCRCDVYTVPEWELRSLGLRNFEQYYMINDAGGVSRLQKQTPTALDELVNYEKGFNVSPIYDMTQQYDNTSIANWLNGKLQTYLTSLIYFLLEREISQLIASWEGEKYAARTISTA